MWQEMVTNDGAFVVDGHQRIIFWNSGAQRLLGHRPEQVEGRLCYEVIDGRDGRNRPVCRPDCRVMVEARRGYPTPDYDLLCPLASTGTTWFNVSVATLRDTEGNPQVLHLFRDVTRRRWMEEFARRTSATLRRLLSEGAEQLSATGDPTLPSPPKLSPREMEVLRLLALGLRTAEIAQRLSIQPLTARNHVARLLAKLGVKSRLQAVIYALERHLL